MARLTLQQLERVLPLGVEWVLLDNFTVPDTAAAVEMRNRTQVKTLLESSGNISLETIAEYARAGVDGASVGRLTHSAGAELFQDLVMGERLANHRVLPIAGR